MTAGYTIRLAKKSDTDQARKLVREAVCYEKKCLDPLQVQADFIYEFVDKLIARGQMLVVENEAMQLELIGEVHDYYDFINPEHQLREFFFVSRSDIQDNPRGQELISWLYDEVQHNHKDVFRVSMTASMGQAAILGHLNGHKLLRHGKDLVRPGGNGYARLVPLSWINPSFN